MAPRGGKRPGAGRKVGAPNKATAARQKAVTESGLTPLDYMLSIMRDKQMTTESRFEAAKAAAPYVHPKLANVEHSGPNGGPIQTESRTWREVLRQEKGE